MILIRDSHHQGVKKRLLPRHPPRAPRFAAGLTAVGFQVGMILGFVTPLASPSSSTSLPPQPRTLCSGSSPSSPYPQRAGLLQRARCPGGDRGGE